ncbi:MAG: alpha/beta fold hydrolase, partial [Gammaproteobacteria bacterium]|nr:alpha/beta fold hydrolase [Gammaproteobacteria bacterium]
MNERAGAPPRGELVQVEDLELHYHDHGADGKKGTVVFVHGSGPGASGHSNFKGNVDCLTEAGYRIIVPDLPGFGYSSKPIDRDYTSDFFSSCLVGLIGALGINSCILVGNSLGGAITIRTALD